MSQEGSCLCGAVKFVVPTISKNFWTCHCNMCRRWGGGPFLSTNCGHDVKFSGEEFIKSYDSSDWAERGFCTCCGTHLFYRLKEDQLYFMPLGLFETDNFKMELQVFIDEKPSYYCFSDDTKKMTGAEAFAAFAPE